tara:strand:+ start:9612 stop:10877 length:1266 start_codon:yes stop_codon:yes gene_type:complete
LSQLFQDDGPKTTGQKVCLATTAYDSPDASHTFSIQRSRQALSKAGIESAYYLLSGNCHVDDGRNSIVKEFLASDCAELVFLDADVSWQPQDLVRLCQHDTDIVGGVYPYRREDKWHSGEMPVRMLEGAEVDAGGLIEVGGLPTGFMKIKRRVIDELAANAEKFKNKAGQFVPILFERTFDGKDRWGGDLAFCNKWRATGGKVYADYEMVLGHTGKVTLRDSLGAAVRRRAGTTLSHVVDRIRAGKETLADITEAREHVQNNAFGATEDVLMLSVLLARKAKGPIIEAGSGLTTILMAAATDQRVYCLEHHGLYAAQLRQLVAEAGVSNVGLCVCPIKDGWYDPAGMEGLPHNFALGLNDGPTRQLGSRVGFFKHFGWAVDTIIADDADDEGFRAAISEWAKENERRVDFIEPRAALIKRK